MYQYVMSTNFQQKTLDKNFDKKSILSYRNTICINNKNNIMK